MHMALETRPWTRAELDRLPDDGNRYEVLNGELLVTPPWAPTGGATLDIDVAAMFAECLGKPVK